MTNPLIVTGTVAVWLPEFYKQEDVLYHIENGNSRAALDMLSYFGSPARETFSNSIRVGEADVTVRLMPRDEQARVAVKALNDKLDKLRAAYLTAQQEVLEQIGKYQAITNEA